jgi:glycosyltransferase involved in cell wall biosynthesis
VAIAKRVQLAGAGFAVEPEPAAITEALVELVSNKARRRTMGEQGQELARRDYSPIAMADRLVSLYRSIASGTSVAA